VIVTIPARLSSSRLPRKLLLDVGGKPLLWHTVQRALESRAQQIFVLTEDVEILDAVLSWGLDRVTPVMTGEANSGTERIARFVIGTNFKNDLTVVNLQGDEPELPGKWIDEVAAFLDRRDCSVATLAGWAGEEDANSASIVKVVRDLAANALYFSRCPIPYGGPWLKHVGLYAYKVDFLKKVPSLFVTTYVNERLEQLNWLQAGHKIAVVVGDVQSVGIDTQHEYLELVKRRTCPQISAKSSTMTPNTAIT
jgi:3-deoxy-manno-octulosonate cytidylyltransferase (CMP-KDO synthetase)